MTPWPENVKLEPQDLCVRKTDPEKLAEKLRLKFNGSFEVHVRTPKHWRGWRWLTFRGTDDAQRLLRTDA